MRQLIVILVLTGLHLQESGSRDKALLEALDAMRLLELSRVEVVMPLIERSNKTGFDSLVTKVIQWKFQSLSKGNIEDFPKAGMIELPKDSSLNQAIYSLFYGEYLYESGVKDSILGYPYYVKAKSIGEKLGSSLLVCESLKRMITTVNAPQEKNNPGSLKSLADEYRGAAFDSFEKDLANLHYWRARSAIDKKAYIDEFLEGEARAEKHGNEFIQAYYLKLLGVKYELYADTLEKYGLSFDNYKKSLECHSRSFQLYEKYLPSYYAQSQLTGIRMNQGVNYYSQAKYDQALELLLQAEKMKSENDDHHDYLLSHWFSKVYQAQGAYDLALDFRNKEIKHFKEDFAKQITLSIAEINTQLETAKKEERIKSQQARLLMRSRIQWITSILAIVIITLLVLRFITARKVNRQNKKLYDQEINQLMANQELRMIQAAIEAEEKERERVAEDLHDRLGSTLSATRMHLDVLEEHVGPESADQADRIKGLLNKAIEDTRQISHNLLSGVLTKFGLRAALDDLKETVEAANSIEVKLDYSRFQNEIPKDQEVQIFRVVQELMSNTLKHAHADKVEVILDQSEGASRVILQDDGLGFDTNAPHHGIGLKNIASRLDKINATWTLVSSEAGTNMTIILAL